MLPAQRSDCCLVALLAEGVDRNVIRYRPSLNRWVALLAEGVDRNKTVVPVWFISNAIALLMEDAGRNYSTAKRVSFQDLPYAVVRSVEPFHLSDHQLRATRWHFWSHTGYFIPMRAKKGKKEHHAVAQCSKWTTKPSCRMPRGSVQVDSILLTQVDFLQKPKRRR